MEQEQRPTRSGHRDMDNAARPTSESHSATSAQRRATELDQHGPARPGMESECRALSLAFLDPALRAPVASAGADGAKCSITTAHASHASPLEVARWLTRSCGDLPSLSRMLSAAARPGRRKIFSRCQAVGISSKPRGPLCCCRSADAPCEPDASSAESDIGVLLHPAPSVGNAVLIELGLNRARPATPAWNC